MKITIKKKVPQSLEFKVTKEDPKTGKTTTYRNIAERNPKTGKVVFRHSVKNGVKPSGRIAIQTKTIEIPDDLTDKTVVVIDEILDRTRDDLEERSWTELVFPLVPFPFLDKYRDPDRYGVDDYWIGVWLSTELQNVISERAKIIDFLNQAEALWIEDSPVVNLMTGHFKGDKFTLSIERDKLHSVRKEIVNQKKSHDDLADELSGSKTTTENTRKSAYYDRIKTVDELLRDVEMRDRCLALISWGSNLTRGKFYKTSVLEGDGNDNVVLLMENLGLLKADWDGLKKQNDYKAIGYRNINITFGADKILDLVDRTEGKNAIIRKQTLEFISRHLGDQSSGERLVKLLTSWGVQGSLIQYPNTKWRMIDTILTYYASSPHTNEQKMLFKIIEEAAHPLMYNGDKEKALEVQDKFSVYLQYDGYCFSDGKITKADDDLIGAIDARQKARNEKPIDPDLANLFSGFLGQPTPQPQPPSQPSTIRIIEMPELKIKGFEENVVLPKPKSKKIQLRKLPADTKWHDVEINFVDEQEVIVRAKNKTWHTTYEEMGFQDERKKLPNKQWMLLRLLASKNGELSWSNNQNLSQQWVEAVKKQKQLLGEALKAYFQIDDDPFYPYKQEKSYKIKAVLVPERDLASRPNERDVYEEDLGIGEFFKEQTPEMNDE